MPSTTFKPAQPELPVAQEFSIQRTREHVLLMRKFQRIIRDIQYPQVGADRFPEPPYGITGERAGAWRAQCFLMSAEVRYSLYLRFLQGWLEKNRANAWDKDRWPLPPWDVAIIFYAHVLMPYRFKSEVERAFPELWAASIEFPLSRMANSQSKKTFLDSEAAWSTMVSHVPPETPYHIVEVDPASGHAVLTDRKILDIRGYLCRSEPCFNNVDGPQAIPVSQWSDVRLGKHPFLCPRCGTSPTGPQPFTGPTFHAFAQISLGVEVWELWDSPLRQLGSHGFIETVLNLIDTSDTALTNAQNRYIKFLYIMKTAKEGTISVPTIDIDLFWHTHQLTPFKYESYCLSNLGRKINHDDSIASYPRSDALGSTKKAWLTTFGEHFLDPNNPSALARIAHQQALLDRENDNYTTAMSQVTVEVRNAQEQYNATYKSLTTAQNAYNAADREASRMRGLVSEIQTAQKRLPHLRFFKHTLYTKAKKIRLAELETEKMAIEQQLADGEPNLATLRSEYEAISQERNKLYKALTDASTKKSTVEREMRSKVDGAKYGLQRLAEAFSAARDENGGPIWSVVGTEADVAPRIVSQRSPVRGVVVSWYQSWFKAKKAPPNVLRPEGVRLLKPYGNRNAGRGSYGRAGAGGRGGGGGNDLAAFAFAMAGAGDGGWDGGGDGGWGEGCGGEGGGGDGGGGGGGGCGGGGGSGGGSGGGGGGGGCGGGGCGGGGCGGG